MKKVLHSLSMLLYTALVVAVLSLALLFIGTKVSLLGYEVKIVQSGSMEPAISTGGIVVITPAETYRLGDIVTYGMDTRNHIPVTHRIVEKTGEGSSATYVTKGDANEDADPRAVGARNVIGKVAFTLPYIGYVIEFARTPLGFALLIGFPALLIVLDEFANIVWEVRKYRYRQRKHQGAQGKRKGPTGYRIPSRNRRPRDLAKAGSAALVKHNQPQFVLDLRNYQTKRSAP